MATRLIGCCAVVLVGFVGLNQAAAGLLSYEGFETGAGLYTAGVALPGQTSHGTGQASGGAWSADDASDSVIQAVGLKHVVASKGGRATHSGNGGSGSRVNLDLSVGGAFGAAGMIDGGVIGGGAVERVVYVSFLTRSSNPSSGSTEPRWAGLTTWRGDTRVQSLGGNHYWAWAYSIFGVSGDQDLLANGVAGTYIGVDTVTRLFVAKISFHAGAADDLTVWMDPDPAAGDAQGATVRSYAGAAIGDLSFDNLRLCAGDDDPTDDWDFDEIRIGTDWASVTPPTTEALASDSFPTGAGGYTAGADLPGQSLLGAGHASGATWSGDDANDSSVEDAGLFHPSVASSGGKVLHSGNDGSAGTGTSGNLDVSTEGPLSLAGLVDAANGIIGAGNASGPLYVSFLVRAHNTSAAEPRWAGLTLYNGDTQVQSLGGNGLGPHAYSIFGRTGVQDLMTNRVVGSWIMVDRDTHLFVAKITYKPAANDDITVWLDPNPANGDSQAASVRNYAGTGVSDFSFNNYRFQAGTTNNSVVDPWEFDEVRFGRTWASVTPARTNELYAYEPFDTGTGRYTANANLPGQTLGGTGHASGLTWTAASADDSTVSPTGLAHIVASQGGMAVHSGMTSTNNGTGTRAALDLSDSSAFAAAGLVSGGAVGGGAVGAPVYVSFLARSHGTSAQEPRFAGLVTYRNGMRVQSLGGNGLPQHAYSTYGVFGTDLITNNVGTAWRGVNTDTHLFVAKITFRADAADDISVWLDPDPADGDSQGPSVYLRSGANVGDLSFDSYELQAGPDGASDTWDFDEIRIGNSWASVSPAPAVPPVLSRDSFKGYAEAQLAGQAYRGTGYAAGGAWSGAGASFALPTLRHAVGWPIAGRAVHLGNNVDLLAYLDTTGAGPFGQARLIDFASGMIGGGNVDGVLYVGFLARAQYSASTATEDTPNDGAYSALELQRGTYGVQTLGGNAWNDWAYSLFGASGEVALLDTFGTGAYKVYDTATRLFVAKITYHAYANDDITVWMDPLRKDGDSQGAGVFMYSATGLADLSFNAYSIRSGNDPSDNGWDFDEVRFSPTFDGALPPAKSEYPLGTMTLIQ